jgi:hypothetical protein
MQVEDLAMTATLNDGDDDDGVQWQKRPQGTYQSWEGFPQELSDAMEKQYKQGNLYTQQVMYSNIPGLVDCWIYPKNPVKITEYFVSEMHGQFSGSLAANNYEQLEFRRLGKRVVVPGEESYHEKNQKMYDAVTAPLPSLCTS